MGFISIQSKGLKYKAQFYATQRELASAEMK